MGLAGLWFFRQKFVSCTHNEYYQANVFLSDVIRARPRARYCQSHWWKAPLLFQTFGRVRELSNVAEAKRRIILRPDTMGLNAPSIIFPATISSIRELPICFTEMAWWTEGVANFCKIRAKVSRFVSESRPIFGLSRNALFWSNVACVLRCIRDVAPSCSTNLEEFTRPCTKLHSASTQLAIVFMWPLCHKP